MTTATTTTVVDQTSDAAFRVWIAEMITQLVTTCGVTQTADTGQVNTATVTRPAINSVAGYSILRFNDTAQATSPIFIKIEYGAGAAITQPIMMITVGTGSNGSGTLTGTLSPRTSIVGATIASTSTGYVSRWCYNTTDGVLSFTWKLNGAGAGSNLATLVLARTNDGTGAPTTAGYFLMTNGNTSVAILASGGATYCYSYGSSSFVVSGITAYAGPVLGLASFNSGGNIYVVPVLFALPVPGVLAMFGLAFAADIPIGTTVTVALVGSTTHTYVSCGTMFGATAPGGITGGTMLMIWE
jgi:hypothetical protein